jgi:hypothetical protein
VILAASGYGRCDRHCLDELIYVELEGLLVSQIRKVYQFCFVSDAFSGREKRNGRSVSRGS